MKISKIQLQTENENLKEQLRVKNLELENTKNECVKSLEVKESEYANKLNELNARVLGLENDLQEKNNELNQKELKKLAKAYEEQENDYKKSSRWWFGAVLLSVFALATSVSISAHSAQDKLWYEKIEYYLVNFVAITFLVFCLKTFSTFMKLRSDFANRKTLAQSYHNILSTVEDDVIKQKFIDKATDILCSSSEVENESYTIPEKFLDTLADISKNLSVKV